MRSPIRRVRSWSGSRRTQWRPHASTFSQATSVSSGTTCHCAASATTRSTRLSASRAATSKSRLSSNEQPTSSSRRSAATRKKVSWSCHAIYLAVQGSTSVGQQRYTSSPCVPSRSFSFFRDYEKRKRRILNVSVVVVVVVVVVSFVLFLVDALMLK
jgi:hypothetical protein